MRAAAPPVVAEVTSGAAGRVFRCSFTVTSLWHTSFFRVSAVCFLFEGKRGTRRGRLVKVHFEGFVVDNPSLWLTAVPVPVRSTKYLYLPQPAQARRNFRAICRKVFVNLLQPLVTAASWRPGLRNFTARADRSHSQALNGETDSEKGVLVTKAKEGKRVSLKRPGEDRPYRPPDHLIT